MKRLYRSLKKILREFFPPRDRVSQYAARMMEFLSTNEREKRFAETIRKKHYSLRARRLARVLRIKMKLKNI